MAGMAIEAYGKEKEEEEEEERKRNAIEFTSVLKSQRADKSVWLVHRNILDALKHAGAHGRERGQRESETRFMELSPILSSFTFLPVSHGCRINTLGPLCPHGLLHHCVNIGSGVVCLLWDMCWKGYLESSRTFQIRASTLHAAVLHESWPIPTETRRRPCRRRGRALGRGNRYGCPG